MRDFRLDRALQAVMHIDMVGYTQLIAADDIGTIKRWDAIRQHVIEPAISAHAGRVVQTAGDSLLVLFTSVQLAVEAALAIQRSLLIPDTDAPSGSEMRFRIGVEFGDVIGHSGDFHGSGVNIASRLQSLCPTGGVCISRSVHDRLSDTLGTKFESRGFVTLKNVARQVEVLVAFEGALVRDSWRADDTPLRVAPVISSGPPVLAVLPFEEYGTVSTVPRHVIDGMLTDVVCQLAGIRDIKVISDGSTLGLRGVARDPRQLGRQLGARYLIQGAFRQADGRIRFSTALLEAETGTVVSARTFELTDLLSFEGQDRVRLARRECALASAEGVRTQTHSRKAA